MHNVWLTRAPREQRRWRVCLQSAFAPDVPDASRPTGSHAVASDSSTAAKLFDVSACCRVRACAWLARRARVVRACRACSARACSCARRRAERRRAGKESGDIGTPTSLVARMRGDARARARREQRAWRARREQRARVQGGRVGARARQRRGRSREEFPVRTFVLSSSRSQISVTLSSVDSELFQNIHNFKIRSRVSAPRPTAPSVACAWLRVHAVSLPPFPTLVLAL